MATPITQKADQFKYRIQELIDELPRDITVEQIIEELKKQGISRRAFFEHKKITISDTRVISEFHLQVYTQVFNIPLHQLLNYKVDLEPIMVIHERNKSTQDKIKIELGLS